MLMRNYHSHSTLPRKVPDPVKSKQSARKNGLTFKDPSLEMHLRASPMFDPSKSPIKKEVEENPYLVIGRQEKEDEDMKKRIPSGLSFDE